MKFRFQGAKGVWWRCSNGYTVSVQIGMGNYCERRVTGAEAYWNELCEDAVRAGIDANTTMPLSGEVVESADAEVAVLTPRDRFATGWNGDEPLNEVLGDIFRGDQVAGWQTFEQVMDLIRRVEALPALKQEEP